jgi:hypothetical protein
MHRLGEHYGLRFRPHARDAQMEDASQMSNHSESDEPTGYSPPCYLRDTDAAYAGYLTASELVEILNELLEGERAGARATIRFVEESGDKSQRAALRKISIDEARCCAMLARHIRALGGMPSAETGGFYDKLVAIEGLPERLALLNRGQGWVVRRLRDVLRCVRDDRLYEDLKAMLEAHEANIHRCNRLLDAAKAGASPAP